MVDDHATLPRDLAECVARVRKLASGKREPLGDVFVAGAPIYAARAPGRLDVIVPYKKDAKRKSLTRTFETKTLSLPDCQRNGFSGRRSRWRPDDRGACGRFAA
jgi:hypothetical protein